ncbi:MAG TPA: hypothetical protein VNO30_23620 [Kofleriaceae bacterium]|nr:hypothetical protein [Kofleriaceae bacterium]
MSPQTPKPPAQRPAAPRPAAPRPVDDRRLAKDVAKHIDRRRVRRKLLWWAILVSAIAIAASYLTCGQGLGLGGLGLGKGKGEGEGPGSGSAQGLLSPVDAGPRRCEVRVAASGITVDGKATTVEEAVAACKTAAGAEVLLTGGARAGDWDDLKAAFERAKIEILSVERRSGGGSTGGSSAAPEPSPAP